MIFVDVKEEWFLEASIFADKRIQACEKAIKEGKLKASRFQTNNQKQDIMLGFIGECALKDYLNKKNIKYEQDIERLGESDNFDIIINNNKIDVKTALRKYPIELIKDNYQLMIQKYQLGLHGDIIFWVIIEGPNVNFIKKIALIGWLRTNEIKKYDLQQNFNSPCYWIPIKEVNEPNDINIIEQ